MIKTSVISAKWTRSIAFAVATAVLATGCTTINPYTQESQTAKSAGGAIIGALAGAAIGAASSSHKDRDKGLLIGALSGAALGSGVGYYMDVQEAKLRQQLASTGISVKRDGNNIILNMPNSITFGVNETHLSTSAKNALHNVALVVKEYPKTQLNILGFTDSTGAAEYNLRLSQVRASAVADDLMREGVSIDRIVTKGLGEAHPIATNSTSKGRAENRRVEIILSPLGQ